MENKLIIKDYPTRDIETVNNIHIKLSKMKNVLAKLIKHLETTSKEELEREFEEIKEWSNVGPTVDEFIKFCECVNNKPKYPTTYKECCDILLISPYYNLRYHTYEPRHNEYATSNTLLSLQDKLNIFGKLIICRNAYWKIAGINMCLDKPWTPNWNDLNRKYFISLTCDGIGLYDDFRNPEVLVFPTEEMRDAFYENFKNLIEQCKELL